MQGPVYELESKLLVSPLLTPIILPYMIPQVTPCKELRPMVHIYLSVLRTYQGNDAISKETAIG